jgi:hypothetical protein
MKTHVDVNLSHGLSYPGSRGSQSHAGRQGGWQVRSLWRRGWGGLGRKSIPPFCLFLRWVYGENLLCFPILNNRNVVFSRLYTSLLKIYLLPSR